MSAETWRNGDRFLAISHAMDECYARVALRCIELECESSERISAMWRDDEHRIASDASEKE